MRAEYTIGLLCLVGVPALVLAHHLGRLRDRKERWMARYVRRTYTAQELTDTSFNYRKPW